MTVEQKPGRGLSPARQGFGHRRSEAQATAAVVTQHVLPFSCSLVLCP